MKTNIKILVQNGFWGKLETTDNRWFKVMHPLPENYETVTGLCL